MWFFFAATITATPQSCLSTLPLQLFRAHGTTKDVAKLTAMFQHADTYRLSVYKNENVLIFSFLKKASIRNGNFYPFVMDTSKRRI